MLQNLLDVRTKERGDHDGEEKEAKMKKRLDRQEDKRDKMK